MRRLLPLIAAAMLITGCKNEPGSSEAKPTSEIAETKVQKDTKSSSTSIKIIPVSHATAVIKWEGEIIYLDPVGGAEAFKDMPKPGFLLITDIHGDHLSAETLTGLKTGDAKIIVPQAVKEKLPEALQNNLIVMRNGETIAHNGFTIEAIPMYNLPQTKDAMHVKGRGNGYVLEKNGERLYISGDTEAIPEMRNLRNIDVALVPMNLPYTMPVDQAAEGVLEFKPKKVIPYHYRGKNGFSDIKEFKRLVNKENKNIEVELMDWYPSK